MLLAAGAAIDPLNRSKETPLAVAIHGNNAGMIRALCRGGAYVNRELASGLTLLQSVVKAGKSDLAVELVSLWGQSARSGSNGAGFAPDDIRHYDAHYLAASGCRPKEGRYKSLHAPACILLYCTHH